MYLFFVYPEWEIYGGIGMGVAACALVSALALSNRSWIWSKVAVYLWPFVIVICAVRAIIMIVELQRFKSHIQWECDNGGQVWTSNVDYADGNTVPNGFCAAGFASLNTAFIFGLLIDLGFQMYMFFLMWRFSKRLEHYRGLQGPFAGGYYKA